MITTLKLFIDRVLNDENGATLVEYVLLIALIAIVCIVAITAVGTQANTKLNNVAGNLN